MQDTYTCPICMMEYDDHRVDNDGTLICPIPEIEAWRKIRHHPMRIPSGREKKVVDLAKRDGWQCHYCATPLSIPAYGPYVWEYQHDFGTRCGYGDCRPGYYRELPSGYQYPEIDHKVPKSKGGTNDLSNLVLCCHTCNSKKGSWYTYSEFLAIRQKQLSERSK